MRIIGRPKQMPEDHRETVTRAADPCSETAEEFGARLRKICQDISSHCDVDRLCRAFPARIQAVADAEGGRIHP